MTTLQDRPTPVFNHTVVDRPVLDRPYTAKAEPPIMRPAARYVIAALRIGLGFIFLWAFADKLWGFGHETTTQAAWINGGNPTKGFLANSAEGPFASFYHNIAGAGITNWLFMLALLGLGVALMAGIGMRIAAVAGALLTLMMWSVVLPPANNVFMDDHLIYAGLFVALALVSAGDTVGFGKIWAKTALVRRAPWLK